MSLGLYIGCNQILSLVELRLGLSFTLVYFGYVKDTISFAMVGIQMQFSLRNFNFSFNFNGGGRHAPNIFICYCTLLLKFVLVVG